MVAKGLTVLDFLMDQQRATEGHFCAIGQDGWLRRDGQQAHFDQQPIETHAMIEAWLAAEQSSPSQQAMRHERAVRLARQLDAAIYLPVGFRHRPEELPTEADASIRSMTELLHTVLLMEEVLCGDGRRSPVVIQTSSRQGRRWGSARTMLPSWP